MSGLAFYFTGATATTLGQDGSREAALAPKVLRGYLLRNLTIDRPNQVWATDIPHIPMRRGFVYLVATVDWTKIGRAHV